MTGRREMGDYQTPELFADKVCKYLRDERQVRPSVVIEPTCGIRNVFAQMRRTNVRFDHCDILEFDAKKEFGVGVSACPFVVCLAPLGTESVCTIRQFGGEVITSLCYENGGVVKKHDVNRVDLWGKCCFEWRQGIKHDCSVVMNLENNCGILRNGKGH